MSCDRGRDYTGCAAESSAPVLSTLQAGFARCRRCRDQRGVWWRISGSPGRQHRRARLLRVQRVLNKAVNLAALLFIGPLWKLGLSGGLRLAFGGFAFAAFATALGFAVQQACLRRRPALIRHDEYSHFDMIPALRNGQYRTGFHVFADLAALAVVTHLAAFDRLFGQRPRFEKTRRPQPFVQSDGWLRRGVIRVAIGAVHGGGMISSKW